MASPEVEMTEEQVDMLRKQIAIYYFISKTMLQQRSHLITSYLPTLPLCPYPPPEKLAEKRRWAPTTEQLNILESTFIQCNGRIPEKSRIKEIADQLFAYGKISEANVSIWFQNKKAQMRKQVLRAQTEGGSQVPPDDVVTLYLNGQDIDMDINQVLNS